MIAAIGLETNKVYAKGTRAQCMRELIEKYPYQNKTYRGSETKMISKADALFPEPLIIKTQEEV